ncbi:MAG TPA: N(G),N(G)-dimethylarginine dimethylaminohydrolase [Gemmatimonadales bacterium]|jgi:dimethylargininase|nr:N(G),N(G)-dimethylarginine dimethylaminohydrolase [Gemmatimonadales bacterium]
MLAFTREVSPAIADCELTHLVRQPIDVKTAARQHESYERCLTELGCRVCRVPGGRDKADGVFIEDTAVVLDELAVITRPGAESRRAETADVADALRLHRPLLSIEPPGTLDGGDVLRVGRSVYVGLSSRTNLDGIRQLARHLAPLGYGVSTVEVSGALHLKSAVSEVAERTLLINRDWVRPETFPGLELIPVDPAEPFGGNALQIGGTVIYPSAFPRTRTTLESRGISVRTVDASELAKAEGGVTCCSLILREASER